MGREGHRERARASFNYWRDRSASVPPSAPVSLPARAPTGDQTERARLEVGTPSAVYVCVPTRDNGAVQDRQTLDHRRRRVGPVAAEDEGERVREKKTGRRSLKFDGTASGSPVKALHPSRLLPMGNFDGLKTSSQTGC